MSYKKLSIVAITMKIININNYLIKKIITI